MSAEAPIKPHRMSRQMREYLERANLEAYERGREEGGDMLALIVAGIYGALIGAGIATAITYELTRGGHL